MPSLSAEEAAVHHKPVEPQLSAAAAPHAPTPEPALKPAAGFAAKAGDLLLLSFSFAMAAGSYLYDEPWLSGVSLLDRTVTLKDLAFIFAGGALFSLCLWVAGIYHGSRGGTMKQLYTQIFLGSSLCTLVAALELLPHLHGEDLGRSLALFWIGSCVLLLLSRSARLLYLRLVKPRLRTTRNAIIVGSGPRAQQLAGSLALHDEFEYNLFGFVDSIAQPSADGAEIELFGALDQLEDIVMRHQIDDVFIALPMRSKYEEIQRTIAICEQAGVQSQYLADLFPTTVTKQRVAEGDGLDRVIMRMVHHDHRRHIKRAVDLFGSFFGLIALSPLFLLVALAIKLTSPGPVFFAQQRYGLNKRLFPMYKFRSMVPDAEVRQAALESQNESSGPVFKIAKDPRVTPIGAILRSSSIDELPQLLNVLLGQMSLVGPRPLPTRDVSRFSEASLMRRFSVKPGMTGLWQVSGRSNTTFSGWISLDLHYIDHWSLKLDTRILLRTVSVVMRRTGAS